MVKSNRKVKFISYSWPQMISLCNLWITSALHNLWSCVRRTKHWLILNTQFKVHIVTWAVSTGGNVQKEVSSSLICSHSFFSPLSSPWRHQLQCPGQYSPLEAFYEDKKAILPPTGNGLVTACPTWSVTNISRCMHPEMKVWKHTLWLLMLPCLECSETSNVTPKMTTFATTCTL